MDLYDVMRTTPAVREFTDDPLPDETLHRILDNARFAPSGGNRQGTHVIVVRDQATRERLAELNGPPCAATSPRSRPARARGTRLEAPIPTRRGDRRDRRTGAVHRSRCSPPAPCWSSASTSASSPSTDQDLDRVGLISGASVYPLVWNILLAARNEGFGGTITTMAVAQEPAVQELLGIPDQYAVAAVLPIGKPVKRLTKLKPQPGRGVRHPRAVRRRAVLMVSRRTSTASGPSRRTPSRAARHGRAPRRAGRRRWRRR